MIINTMGNTIRLRVRVEDYNIIKAFASFIESYRRSNGGPNKDENENEEKVFPCNPLSKEEKEKEERDDVVVVKNKKSKKETFFIPSFREIEEYHKEINVADFTAEEFYDYYQTFGWLSKEGLPIQDWKAVMRSWVRKNERNNLKQQNDEKKRQTQGAGAQNGTTQEELLQAIIDYLDTHYPVADKSVEYVVAHGMGRDAKLGDMAARLGTAPVLRVVIKRLFVTGYAMDLKPQMLNPSTLDKTANRLCEKGWLLTMRQGLQFQRRCVDKFEASHRQVKTVRMVFLWFRLRMAH